MNPFPLHTWAMTGLALCRHPQLLRVSEGSVTVNVTLALKISLRLLLQWPLSLGWDMRQMSHMLVKFKKFKYIDVKHVLRKIENGRRRRYCGWIWWRLPVWPQEDRCSGVWRESEQDRLHSFKKQAFFYRIFSDNQRIRKKVRKCLEMDENKTQNTKTYGTCLEIVLRRKSKVSCMYIQRLLP